MADIRGAWYQRCSKNFIEAQLAPAAVASQINYAVAAKSLDAERQEGAAAVRLVEGAGQIPVAENGPLTSPIDIMA